MTEFHLGVTGSRFGPSSAQKVRALAELDATHLHFLQETFIMHHGDCVGADAWFANLGYNAGYADMVMCHPPDDPKERAYAPSDLVLSEQPYLVRNRDIVDSSDMVLALAPKAWGPNSGTWYTINYAVRKKKPIIAIDWEGDLIPLE